MRTPTRKVSVDCTGEDGSVPAAVVRRTIYTVLDGENIGAAEFSVTFLSSQRMRALNRRWFGHDRATDVIAFGLPHLGLVVGDIHICPSVARRSARELKESEQEEMVRLLVHGALHALGYEHQSGDKRYSSDMWRIQEEYVKEILRGLA